MAVVTLRFVNRTAVDEEWWPENIKLRVEREAVPHMMAWYGAYYAGDDYDVFINGREVGKGINGEFEPVMIDA